MTKTESNRLINIKEDKMVKKYWIVCSRKKLKEKLLNMMAGMIWWNYMPNQFQQLWIEERIKEKEPVIKQKHI